MTSFDEQVTLAKLLPEIGRKIDEMIAEAGLPRQPWSFYTWGGKRCQYIGNTLRSQSRTAMKEVLNRWEQNDPPPDKFDS